MIEWIAFCVKLIAGFVLLGLVMFALIVAVVYSSDPICAAWRKVFGHEKTKHVPYYHPRRDGSPGLRWDKVSRDEWLRRRAEVADEREIKEAARHFEIEEDE